MILIRLSILLLCGLLVSCVHAPLTNVQISTVYYPPFVEKSGGGVILDILTEAYQTQGITIEITVFDSLSTSMEKAENGSFLWLGSRIVYAPDKLARLNYQEIYLSKGSILSIEGTKEKKIFGVLESAGDELQYAREKQLTTLKYNSINDGLKLLYQGKIDALFCGDLLCEQIRLSNPNIKFHQKFAYAMPVDLIAYPSDGVEGKLALDSLKRGLAEITKNGQLMALLNRYRIVNPLMAIPMEQLPNIRVD